MPSAMSSTAPSKNIDPAVCADFSLVGGENLLKRALRLMTFYRLRIDEIKGNAVVTSYTRWLESVPIVADQPGILH